MDADIIVEQRLDARPLTTYAQFMAEVAEGRPDAGVQRAMVNLNTVMGGFSRFRGTEAEGKACARFLMLHERSQVGGARAVDPSLEPVDGGWRNPEAVFEIGADARREWIRLTNFLGKLATHKLSFVIVGGNGPTPYAKHFYRVRKPNAVQVSRGMVEVREMASEMARFMGLQTR